MPVALPVELTARPLRIAIVTGEASGDQLGAGVIRALRARHPDAEIVGVGGPRMASAGFEAWADQDRLAVMGLVEVLKHLPDLLQLRRQLLHRILEWQPDVFLGIDSPDFNLPLARKLRARGVTTAHYVSPSVWAWRQGRVKGIRASVDLMINLFPFENDFYARHDVPHVCVGHTLADELPLTPETSAYRAQLGITTDGPVLAVLPGSRRGEVAQLAADFLAAARLLKSRLPDLQVLIPAVNAHRRQQIEAIMMADDTQWMTLVDGQGHVVMGASDAVLLASGTATLEAALLKKPMVVGYRFNWLTYQIARRVIRTPWAALPNVLAQRTLVTELLQDDLSAESAAEAIFTVLQDSPERQACIQAFTDMHQDLKRNADVAAAETLLALIQGAGFRPSAAEGAPPHA